MKPIILFEARLGRLPSAARPPEGVTKWASLREPDK
jgi:hypothetical protein